MSRHRWVTAGLLAAAVVIGACGADRIETSEAPGFSDNQREVDRSPFSLPEPLSDGSSTTLPGSPTLPLPDDIAARTRPGSPTTTTASTTTTSTTTTLPGSIVVAAPDTIFNLCGFSYTLVSLRLAATDPDVDLRQLTTDIRAALVRYEVVAPSAQKPAVEIVSSGIERILTALEASGFDRTAPEPRDLIDRANRKAAPFEQFETAATEIRVFEDDTCPGR